MSTINPINAYNLDGRYMSINDTRFQPKLLDGGSWVAGSASVVSSLITYGTVTYLDLTGGVLPAAPTSSSRFRLLNATAVLVYSSGSYPARPPQLPAGGASYIGPSQPTDWVAQDTWTNNS